MSRLYSPDLKMALMPSIPKPIAVLLYSQFLYELRDMTPIG